MPQAGDSEEADNAFAALEKDYLKFVAKGDVVILGDFNAHCGKPLNDEEELLIGKYGPAEKRGRNGTRMMKFLRSCSARSMNCRVALNQGDLEYTRADLSTGKQSVLDHAVVSAELTHSVMSTTVDPVDLGSDHRMVVIESGMREIPRCKPVKAIKWRRAKLTKRSNKEEDSEKANEARDLFQKEVGKYMKGFNPEIFPQTKEGAATALKDWLSRVEQAGNESVGRKVVQKRYSQKWFDNEVKEAIGKRRAKYQKYKRTGSIADFVAYRQLRREVYKLVTKKKKEQWEMKLESITTEFEDNTKLFWSLLSELTGGRTAPCSGPIRDADGVLQVDEKGRSEALAAFYEKLGMPIIQSPKIREDGSPVPVGDEEFADRYDDQFRKEVEEFVENCDSERPEVDRHHDREFTVDEVAAVLKQLKNGRATGGDGVPPEFLKYGGAAMAEALCKLFNWIFAAGHTPEQWGKALVILLYKKGDPTDPGNYRGISLLDVVGKVFTKLVAKRIEETVKDVIVEEQAGFTAKRGCPEHIYALYRMIRGRKKEGKDTYLFFLDVRKAFDTVWRDGLLKKLWTYGVRGKLWRTVRAMYADNLSAILVDGKPSRWFKILQGVRQGDSASPCLFKVFVNELAVELKNLNLGVPIGCSLEKLQALLFADDIVLLADNLEDLQKMIDTVAKYSRKWRFQENLGKCGMDKVQAFKGGQDADALPEVNGEDIAAEEIEASSNTCKFLGEDVVIVSKYEYLGVYFHESATWDEHVKAVIKKGKKAVNNMMRVFKNRQLPVKLRVKVWETVVLPKIMYAAEVWYCSNVKQRNALETLQNSVAAAILHCNRKTSSIGTKSFLGLQSLWLRRGIRVLDWKGRLACRADSLLKKVHQAEWTQGPMRKGPRPRSWAMETNYWLGKLKLNEDYQSLADYVRRYRDGEFDGDNDAKTPNQKFRAWASQVRKRARKFNQDVFKEEVNRARTSLGFMGSCLEKPGLIERFAGTLNGTKLINVRFCLGTHALCLHCATDAGQRSP
jgi:hypothetical protein